MESFLEKIALKLGIKNPEQQMAHLTGAFFVSFALNLIPFIGDILKYSPLVYSFYKELIEDGHWKDIFKPGKTASDGRQDLVSRLVGSILGVLTG